VLDASHAPCLAEKPLLLVPGEVIAVRHLQREHLVAPRSRVGHFVDDSASPLTQDRAHPERTEEGGQRSSGGSHERSWVEKDPSLTSVWVQAGAQAHCSAEIGRLAVQGVGHTPCDRPTPTSLKGVIHGVPIHRKACNVARRPPPLSGRTGSPP